MLSWVVKVVPQPPEPPPKKAEDQKEVKPEAPPIAPPPVEKKVKFQDECKPEAPKADNLKPEVQAAPENGPLPGSQAGVLTWISSALPQPALSPKLSRASSTASEEAAPASKPEDEKGMITWISQGLEKVVPQPDLKAKEMPAAEQPAEVKVCQKAAAPVPAAEPQIIVVEVESDQEDSRPVQPSMMEWIKHGIEKVVPQPEIHVRSKTDGNQKTEAPAAAKAEAPAAPAASKPNSETEKSTKEAEQPPNMMGWIISGIGRMLPQPVQKPETGNDDVPTISVAQKKSDLVLEDVEDEEAKKQTKEKKELQKEDAETQMDELTPLMESIKKEAGEAVLAHMEERLQQERLEAARVAEEMARKAAEEAVRQLEVEHSAKIIIETLPESNEQLPNIQEEENEDDPECLLDVCPAEVEEQQEEPTKAPSPPAEDVTPSSTDVEPASER